MGYKPLKKGFYIGKSEIEGQGVFCVEPLMAGSHMGATHIELEGEVFRINAGGFFNHSDDSNCEIIKTRVNGRGGYSIWNIFATKDIKANEELTLTYKYFNNFKDEDTEIP